MKFFKMLIVASLVAIATIEAWPYVAASAAPAATPPRHGKRLVRMGRTFIGRIVAPITARERHSRWR